MAPTRALVAGAQGLVGARLAGVLRAAGHEVTGTARPRPEDARSPAQPLKAVNLARPADVEALVDEVRPDVVFNASGMTDVDACERDPCGAWRGNVEVTVNLCRAAKRVGAHLVHLSTDYVFDGRDGPYPEDATPNPHGAYALSKHASELAVRALLPASAVVRTAVVYGWPPERKQNFGAWLVTQLAQGQPVKLFWDQVITPTLAESCARMVAEIGLRGLAGTWHAAGEASLDRVAFGRALCATFGFDEALLVPTALADVKLAGPRPPRAGLRVDRARAELSEKPLPLDDALRRFHAEWRASSGG